MPESQKSQILLFNIDIKIFLQIHTSRCIKCITDHDQLRFAQQTHEWNYHDLQLRGTLKKYFSQKMPKHCQIRKRRILFKIRKYINTEKEASQQFPTLNLILKLITKNLLNGKVLEVFPEK